MLLVLQPILRGIWSLLVWLGPGAFQFLVDGAYTNAALGNRDWVPAMLAICCLAGLIGLILGMTFGVVLPNSLRKRWRQHRAEMPPDKRRRFLFWSRTGTVIVAVVAIFTFLYMAGSIWIDLQLNAGFNQRLAVLSASVPDQTVKNFRASWARMTSRNDYVRINTDE